MFAFVKILITFKQFIAKDTTHLHKHPNKIPKKTQKPLSKRQKSKFNRRKDISIWPHVARHAQTEHVFFSRDIRIAFVRSLLVWIRIVLRADERVACSGACHHQRVNSDVRVCVGIVVFRTIETNYLTFAWMVFYSISSVIIRVINVNEIVKISIVYFVRDEG